MTDWHEDRERLAAQVEDLMAGWHDSVERVPGEDGDDDTIVGRDGDRVAAILLLDEENVEAMVEAEAEGELIAQPLGELDEGDDDELDAAADAWLGADESDEAPVPAEAAGPADEDDFDLDDWDDPEADALIDELPR